VKKKKTTPNRIQKFLSSLSSTENLQTLAFWATAFLAGLVAVSYASLFKQIESVYRDIYQNHPLWLWAWSPLCLLAAWALIHFLAPEASGSGIPQVLAADQLEHKKQTAWVDRLLSVKGIFIKIASSLLACLGGAVTGREGPTIQISTAIFHGVNRGLNKLGLKTDPSSWIVAGAAAGLASAFNTPLGGIVFAIEEMSVHFKKFRTVLFSSIIIAGLVSQWIMGSYLYLGHPAVGEVPVSVIGWALVVGLVSGCFGAIYGKGIKGLITWRSKLLGTGSLAFLAVLCGVVMTSFAMINPQAAGSGAEVIASLLFKGQVSDWSLPILRALGSLTFYISGAAGGIFAPALAAGACTGSFISSLFQNDMTNLMVLMGMVGFLTGVTRTPFTAFVLVMEMTDDHRAIFPIMLAALSSELVAHAIDPESFYEWAKHRFMPARGKS
jgi:H+/Cl- antiporter ClcA